LNKPETATKIRNMLSRFDPADAQGRGGSAQLYDNYLQSLREYKGLPTEAAVAKTLKAPEAPTPKAVPPAPKQPKMLAPKPVKPEIMTIGTAELDAAKRASLEQEIRQVDRFGGWILPMAFVHTTMAALSLNAQAFFLSFLDVPAYLWTREKIAQGLERPGVQDWIVKPSPKDIKELMKLPPEYRGVIQQRTADLVRAAQDRGIRPSPQLLGFVAGQGTPDLAPRRNPTDEWADPQP